MSEVDPSLWQLSSVSDPRCWELVQTAEDHKITREVHSHLSGINLNAPIHLLLLSMLLRLTDDSTQCSRGCPGSSSHYWLEAALEDAAAAGSVHPAGGTLAHYPSIALPRTDRAGSWLPAITDDRKINIT